MSYKEFNKMIDELYDIIGDVKKNNKFFIPEPIISKKPTRLDWINVNQFLKAANRSNTHFLNYITNTRKIIATFDNSILMIQGKYRKDDLTKIIKEYLNIYSKCNVCNSLNTTLLRDTKLRKDKISCNKCKSINYC